MKLVKEMKCSKLRYICDCVCFGKGDGLTLFKQMLHVLFSFK